MIADCLPVLSSCSRLLPLPPATYAFLPHSNACHGTTQGNEQSNSRVEPGGR